MERVIKLTYFDGYDRNIIKAKQFKIYGWYNLSNELISMGIQESWVLKIEVVFDVPVEIIN